MERPLGERCSIERRLEHHHIKREHAHHQRRHPPCVVGPNDARPLQAVLLEDLDGSDVILDLLLVLLWDAPLPP